MFVVDYSGRTLRKVVVATRQVTTIAGFPGAAGYDDGIGLGARFQIPEGVALTSDGATARLAAGSGVRFLSPSSVGLRANCSQGSPEELGHIVLLGPTADCAAPLGAFSAKSDGRKGVVSSRPRFASAQQSEHQWE